MDIRELVNEEKHQKFHVHQITTFIESMKDIKRVGVCSDATFNSQCDIKDRDKFDKFMNEYLEKEQSILNDIQHKLKLAGDVVDSCGSEKGQIDEK